MPAATLDQPEATPAVPECPSTVEVDTRKLFAILTAHWKSDMHVKASSDPCAVLKNPAYQMTMELGRKVLPLIFNEYEREEDDWAIALHYALGFTPVPEEHYGRVKLIREDWLAWGKANGYLGVESASNECPSTVQVDTRKLFAILTACWKSDMHVKVSSDPCAVLKNPAFQMMIALGKGIVPLLFKEYEKENDKWGIALTTILDFSPVPEEHYGRIGKIREDWMAWGTANGYL